jgi:hexosaminidase
MYADHISQGGRLLALQPSILSSIVHRTMRAKKGLVVALLLSATSALALWPIPRKLSTGSTPLLLSNSFAIELSDVERPPDDLKHAVARTQVQLKNDKLERLVVGRGAADIPSLAGAKTLRKLKVSLGPNFDGANGLASISEEATKPIDERSEGYNLTIPADGSDATLSASSALG